MRRWLREPLVHFLLMGCGLFLVHAWVGGPAKGEGTSIVITQGRIEQLTVGFLRMHQRLPNQAELEALIDDAIREEIYYREAKALGLDQDDTIVRRRLRQKLEFVSEDIGQIPEPTDEQLEVHLRDHAQQFRVESRYSLTQVYLDPQKRGPRLMDDANALLDELRRVGPAVEAKGDASLMQQRYDKVSASELSRLFGKEFETALRAAPLGAWSGPWSSGYGVHLVLVRERDAERAATLREKRDEVRRAWIDARHAEGNARFYASLRKRYDVTVVRPVTSARPVDKVTGLGR
jgi:hypothetical protein